MTPSLRSLYDFLEPLRLYSLHTGGLIDRELASYAAGFAVVETLVSDIEQQAFVQTADGDCLSRHERMVGLSPRESLGNETRRELILYRMGAAPLGFTPEGMLGSIRAAGMEAELAEDLPGEALRVRCTGIIDTSLDFDRLCAAVNAMLPAHLECTIDFGELIWDMFDEAVPDWDDWDVRDFTWTEFDLNAHTLFDNETEG